MRNATIMEYKSYKGEALFDDDDKRWYCKIDNLARPDLIMTEGKTLNELEDNFQEAVDEYITWLAVKQVENSNRIKTCTWKVS